MIIFSSGYMANLDIISSLVGPSDHVIIDSRVHRNVIDACRLTQVPAQSFRHNDLSSLQKMLEKKPYASCTLIVVEGIYSMDGPESYMA